MNAKHENEHLAQENHALRQRISQLEHELHALRSQRTRAQQSLIESEARYRTLVETSPGAILLTSLDGTISFCNQQAAWLFGYAAVDELCGKNGTELIVSDTPRPGSLAHVRQIAESGKLRNMAYTLARKDGSHFPAEVNSAVVTDHQGTPTALIIIVQDISERKQAEQALTDAYNHLAELNQHVVHSRDVLQAIFDGLEDGLLLLDGTGIVQTVNRSLASLLGSTPRKLVGQSWSAIYPRIAPDFPSHMALFPSANGRQRYQHTRYRNLDGGTRILDVQTIALSNTWQHVDHIIVHVTDVTERVQLQARVIENERFAASGRLAASVAHEINTPLQSIQTALGLLGVASEDRRATYLHYALEETQRVGRIVRQLLDLYRPGAAVPGAVDINALIERLLLLIGKRLRDNRVAVEQALAPDIPPLPGRADELMQVLLNLMINAIEAMPDGGTLHVRTSASQGDPAALTVAIGDTGCGIAPELQTRILEPFFTTKEEGIGLGLSISSQIVQQHQGSIHVKSQPGQGSTFTIVLPYDAINREETAA